VRRVANCYTPFTLLYFTLLLLPAGAENASDATSGSTGRERRLASVMDAASVDSRRRQFTPADRRRAVSELGGGGGGGGLRR